MHAYGNPKGGLPLFETRSLGRINIIPAADVYIPLLVGIGALILLVAWLPMVLKELPLSLPIVCVAVGVAVFGLVPALGNVPHPLSTPVLAERLTEIVILVALTGAGLKLDRPVGWRRWMLTWRLLGITMPLSIIAFALLGWGLLGLNPAAALLLGAALAPTDPVLASDVQVGPPRSGEEDEVRFSLTSEAGLNDGLAFPFVNLAIAVAAYGSTPGAWTLEWLGWDVLWKLAAGIGMGVLVGQVLGWLTFHMPNRAKLAHTGDGFVALGITLLAYGAAELAHGYGFLAVFVAALALRNAERGHDYHERLHEFIEQTERLLMMVLLVLFGGALLEMLWPLDWAAVLFVMIALFVIRPVAGMIGFIGSRQPWHERGLISFFGIRGLGSFYYLAYALNHSRFDDPAYLWAVVSFAVLVSITVHGITVTPLMRLLDRRYHHDEDTAGVLKQNHSYENQGG